jgi:integrase
VETLRGAFGFDKALDITADRIARYTAARLEAGKQPATVNRELAALRRMFSLAVRAGKLAGRPPITLLTEDNAREGFIDRPEFERFLGKLRELDEAAVADVVEFAYLTCLRRGNALGAVWTWFSLRVEHDMVVGGSVRLPGTVTKNKRPLALALTGQLLALVARRWAQRVPESPYVFHRRGRRLVRFDTAWDAACEAVGLPGLLFHDLRRSGARNYRRAGVGEDVFQRIGGWKTASMLKRYNIVDERDLADAGERLSVFLTGAASAAPTIVPIADARATRRKTGHEQNTDNRADAAVVPAPEAAVSS